MIAGDFSYDGVRLSDLGFMICKFDGGGLETVQSGSQISFNLVPVQDGRIHNQTSSTYEETITATFQICKAGCNSSDDLEISGAEMRGLLRWLNSKTMKQLIFYDSEYEGCYFDASFNVGQIEMDGKIVGLELTMLTNSPFAYKTLNVSISGTGTKTIIVQDDLVEFVYPEEVVITMNTGGTLNIGCKISNSETRTVTITGCTSTEVITIKRPVITSSVSGHNIASAFNWEFPVLVSSPTLNSDSTSNTWTVDKNCTIAITYRSPVKVIL